MLAVIGSTTLYGQQPLDKAVQLKWRPATGYDGNKNLGLQLVLINKSTQDIVLDDQELWFNSMFQVIEAQTDKYSISNLRGNLFRVDFKKQKIRAKDSLVVDYTSQFAISNISTAPTGFYFQSKSNPKNYQHLRDVTYQPVYASKEEQRQFAASLYDNNAERNMAGEPNLVFPTPRALQLGDGVFALPLVWKVSIPAAFEGAFAAVGSDPVLNSLKIEEAKDQPATFRVEQVTGMANEGYSLSITDRGVHIKASSLAGVFYAVQTFKSLLLTTKGKHLPFVDIVDEPRFAYRGFMMDVSRNFRSKETILKYLDLMAAYKLNVFHFHFSDDEGWRIEIPSLPELTEVGAQRSPLFKSGSAIQPAYGSGALHVGPQYLTRADFIDILRYAKDRFITVVPEIETPGHGRAAIKAMEYRYHRLLKAGNKSEAERYLLSDLSDASVYNSAQNFGDNVMNPALPSTYAFIDQVITEFQGMYQDAGLTLERISLGGDEVPNGVWEKSPQAQQLMAEKGFTSALEIWPYYIDKVNAICRAKGIAMAGWEEVGMVNKGKGMVVNTELPNRANMQVDVWNNVIGGGQEDLAYRLANAGYKTVLISASNMYFDMMWNTNFDEPGLKWATYADLYHAYSLLPEDYFANITTYYRGKTLGKAHFDKHKRLDPVGKDNFIGIKGGIWSETIHAEADMDYMVLPRFFTLAERAWSPKRGYESEADFTVEAFNTDYARFINRLGHIDLPHLARNFNFRLPAVGVKEIDGQLYANIEYPGFHIYYSLEGNPTAASQRYQSGKPIPVVEGRRISFAVIDSKGRVGPITYFTK
ncbi:beta-N-acetylhexosaminidase [Sphingobacterium sp. Mn56C]|uniref:beta-N-acetylhexosaminidase n=1 Tax=Sphingobacterium sp. Mn56C TaxID=3395261 RepID=UPI003BE03B25